MPDVDDIEEIDKDKILREIFEEGKDIQTRTELTSQQIENINKVKTMAMIVCNPLLDDYANNFMRLQKSKDRSSLKEFVDLLRSKRGVDDAEKREGFFKNFFG